MGRNSRECKVPSSLAHGHRVTSKKTRKFERHSTMLFDVFISFIEKSQYIHRSI